MEKAVGVVAVGDGRDLCPGLEIYVWAVDEGVQKACNEFIWPELGAGDRE